MIRPMIAMKMGVLNVNESHRVSVRTALCLSISPMFGGPCGTTTWRRHEERHDLIVIDELGYLPFSQSGRIALGVQENAGGEFAHLSFIDRRIGKGEHVDIAI